MRKFLVTGLLVIAALAASVTAAFAQEATETPAVTSGAWLGVAVVEQNEQVVIARVRPGSPAAAADLLIGDVVSSIDGAAVATIADLSAALDTAAAGDTITLDLLRAGEAVSVDVTLIAKPENLRGDRPDFGNLAEADPLMVAERVLGADLEASDEGYTVAALSENRNPLALEVGDVITTVNGQAVAELDLQTLIDEMAAAETPTLTVDVVRGDETVTLEVELSGMRFGFGGRGPGQGGMPGDGGFGGHGPGNGGNGGWGGRPGNGGNGGWGGRPGNMPPVSPDAAPDAEAVPANDNSV